VHAIVLVSKLHKPTCGPRLRQGDPAQHLEAVYVDTDAEAATSSCEDGTAPIDVPLKVLTRPYRECPADRGLRARIREANPRGVVAVYIPEYVVGRWWEQLLHNQTALRLKGGCCSPPV
jgi:hypothetical protein